MVEGSALNKRQTVVVMLAALLLIGAVSIVLWYFPTYFMREQIPFCDFSSENGAWDVTEVDFDKGFVFLTAKGGGIEHAPGVLLTPEEFDAYEGEIIGNKGVNRSLRVVTARLKIRVPEQRTYMIMFKSNDYNQRTWINGELRGEVGYPAMDPAETRYGFAYHIFEAQPNAEGIIEIVKQTANYVHKDTGTLGATFIGHADILTRFYAMTQFFPSITMGVLLCLFVVHIILFMLFRGYGPNLWFALFCLVWLVRCGLTDGKPLYVLFPGIDWELSYRLGCVSIALTGVLILLFFRSQFPGVVQKWALIGLLVAAAGFCVYYLVADTNIVSRAKVGAEVLAVGTGVYLVARGIQKLPGMMRRKQVHFEQWLTLFGVGLVAVAMLHDALYYAGFHTVLRDYLGISGMWYQIGDVSITAFVLLEMVAMFCGTMRYVAEARRDASIAIESAELARKNETLAHLEAENLRKDIEIREQLAAGIPKENLVVCGPLTLNTLASQAFLNADDLLLTPKEFSLLLYLVQNAGEVISQQALFQAVWKQEMLKDDKALRSHISRLRVKLEPSGCTIQTVRGKGYCFIKAEQRA